MILFIQGALCTLYGPLAYSQTEWQIFKAYNNSPIAETPKLYQFGNFMYLPDIGESQFRVLDFSGTDKLFNRSSLSTEYVINRYDNCITIPDGICFPSMSNYGGYILKFTDIETNPTAEIVTFETLFGIIPPTGLYPNINPAAVQYFKTLVF